MSDIFISYAKDDRPSAGVIASALEEQGWSVWWDRKIPPGRVFDEVITEALDSAQCVIVLWSKFSVGSDWVKEEAAEGARRRVLVPALIDDVPIPLGFRRIQAAQLIAWQGDSGDSEFRQLLESVSQILGTKPRAEPPQPEPPIEVRRIRPSAPSQPKKHSPWLRGSAAIVAFAIVLCASWIAVDFLFIFAYQRIPSAGTGLVALLRLVAVPGVSLWLAFLVWRRLR
jgi:hypothetical protein